MNGKGAARLRSLPARKIILLGASTGGTEALKTVLTSLGGNLPGICIVQHIPAYFSKAFADRLNQICAMEVREAIHGDVVQPGLALIAPGGRHLLLKWRDSHYVVELSEGPPVHHQRPSVDIMFDSAVKAGAGPHAIAALLTGMGADGAAGLLRLRQAGAAHRGSKRRDMRRLRHAAGSRSAGRRPARPGALTHRAIFGAGRLETGTRNI